ncbi:hypothetical protein [Lysobacter gummosus]|uniref:hypothetical protein n=1 Tax=Lysobacter gummosus TaxID=262324 RepID=UPI00363E1D50
MPDCVRIHTAANASANTRAANTIIAVQRTRRAEPGQSIPSAGGERGFIRTSPPDLSALCCRCPD